MDCIEANQLIEPLRKEFDIRFYRWAEEDLRREIYSGFRWVKKVKSNRPFHYLEFLMGLPPLERTDAALALLRTSIVHRKARTQLGLQLTEAEQKYVEQFNTRFYPVALLSEREKVLQEENSPEQFDIDRNSFEKMLETQISDALNQPSVSSRACTFKQEMGGWFVETSVDVHSIYQLRYGHTIVARNADDLCPVQLREGSVSLLGWLGIHPATNFDLLRHSDLQGTAEFMIEVIHHFLSALPPLLKGLKNTIPEEISIKQPRAGRHRHI